MTVNSPTSRAEPANLPALRGPRALAVRTPDAAPPGRRGRVLPVLIAGTVIAFPFAGTVLSLLPR